MSNIVRKFIPDDMWNIGKNESWFMDMSASGLHLKNIGRVFVSFEKGEPSKTKYRIDVINENPSQEQLDTYKECGWNFVTKAGMFYIFSASEDSDSPELHSDPIVQGFTLEELNRINRKNLIVISIAVLFIIVTIASIYLLEDEPYIYIAKGYIVQQILLVIVEIYALYTVFRSYKTLRNLKSLLLNGTPINHKEKWKKGRLLNAFVNTAILAVSIFTIIIPIMNIANRDEYTLEVEKNILPIIRLSDIEENPNMQRDENYNDEGIDRNNSVIYEWSPLAPNQFSVYERGIVNGEMWNDKSGEYSPSIHTEFYQLTFKNMADGLINDLMHRNLYDPRIEAEKVENAIFDQLYYAVDNESKYLFAGWDNNVIYINYHGNKDMDKLVGLLLEIVK